MTPTLGVSVVLPSDWSVLPVSDLQGHNDPSGSHTSALRAVVDGLRDRAAPADVVFCACGTIDRPGGPTGVGVVVSVRERLEPGALDALAGRLEAADPPCSPQQEICLLPLAGPAARLAWTPEVGPGPARVICAEYYLPFPDDDRVAVLACSAVGAPELERTFHLLDGVAATLCLVDPAEPEICDPA